MTDEKADEQQETVSVSDLGGEISYTFNRDQLEALANKLLEQLEFMAYNNGLITDKYLFSRNFAAVLVRPNTFTNIFDTIFMAGVPENSAVFRILSLPIDLEEFDPDELEEHEEKSKHGAKIFTLVTGGKSNNNTPNQDSEKKDE